MPSPYFPWPLSTMECGRTSSMVGCRLPKPGAMGGNALLGELKEKTPWQTPRRFVLYASGSRQHQTFNTIYTDGYYKANG